jgi:hypothetical protein
MAAQAIPSYAPNQAAAHFNKLECFCFNQYTLEAGEKKQWPVAFVIDPQAVQRCDDDHPVLHILRGRGQDATGAHGGCVDGDRCEGGFMNAPVQQARPSFLRTVKTVAWSFLGIRKNSEYKQDLATVNPFHIIVVGIGAAVLFVVGLIVLVNWVVR